MKQEENNKKDYMVLPICSLYKNPVGTVKWIVISDLTKNDLVKIYPEEMGKLKQFEVLSTEQYSVIKKGNRNDRKHQKRNRKDISYDAEDAFIEDILGRNNPDPLLDIIQASEFRNTVQNRCALTTVEKVRLQHYYYNELTVEQIGEMEGVCYSSAYRSIKRAIRKIRKRLELDGEVSHEE